MLLPRGQLVQKVDSWWDPRCTQAHIVSCNRRCAMGHQTRSQHFLAWAYARNAECISGLLIRWHRQGLTVLGAGEPGLCCGGCQAWGGGQGAQQLLL